MLNRRFIFSIVAGLVLTLALVAWRQQRRYGQRDDRCSGSGTPLRHKLRRLHLLRPPPPRPLRHRLLPLRHKPLPLPPPRLHRHLPHGPSRQPGPSIPATCVILGDTVSDCPLRSPHAWKPAKQQVPGEVWVFQDYDGPRPTQFFESPHSASVGEGGRNSAADGTTPRP